MTDTITTMSRDGSQPMSNVEDDPVVAAATAGDEAAFGRLVERHRRELHVHCYRMLGSFEEAEDTVQETFLRAWRARDSFEGGPGFRAWLYRIATNASLDAIKRSSRRVASVSSFAEVPWLQPYPDRLLDEVAPSDAEPDAVVVARETIELTFLAVIQLLPPQQRAVLILRDVLDWSAAEAAALLDTTVAAANSALQRARATLREQLQERPARAPRHATSAPMSMRCYRASSRPMNAATPRPPPRCCARTCASRCRPIRCATTASTRSRRCCSGPSGRTRWATGAPCPRAPTASPRPPATCARRATPSTGRSSSTCCASRTARSRRSRPSTPTVFAAFGLAETL